MLRHRLKKKIQKSNTIISCHEILYSMTNYNHHQKSGNGTYVELLITRTKMCICVAVWFESKRWVSS